MTNLKIRLENIAKVFEERWLPIILSAISLSPISPVTEKMITAMVSSITKDLIVETIKKGLLDSDPKDIRSRAKEATRRIEEATQIINELQIELNTRSEELDELINLVTKRQSEAEHWATLASANEELASAFTRELEKRVREQLRAELDKGKRQRQIIGAVSWVITLIIGAFVGAIVQQWWQTGSFFPQIPPTPLP